MELFSGIGLALPLSLAVLPFAVAGLVYAYRMRGQGKRVVVASILLLKVLQKTVSTPRKFAPPPRFFLELLLLLLLLLGAAGLYSREGGRMYALVLDNSLSMQGLAPQSGDKFLNRAKSDSEAFLSSLNADDRVAMYVTAPAPQLLGERPLSGSEALAALKEVHAHYASADLDVLIPRLLRNDQYERVLLFTDVSPMLQRDSKSTSGPSLLEVRGYATQANLPENLALGRISLKRGGVGVAASVEVISYARQLSNVTVELEVLQRSSEVAKFVSYAKKSLELAAGSTASVVFPDIPSDFQQFRAQLRVAAARSTGRVVDALAEDNVTYYSGERNSGVIPVISRLSVPELGLNAVSASQFEQIAPEKYAQRAAQLEPGSTAIFHRITPVDLPRVNALFVAPSADSTLFSIGKAVQQAAVSRWRESHPILTYLNLPELQLKNFSSLNVPEWARDLIVTSEGVTAFAGEKDGFRYVVLGFEVFPFEGRESPTLSIMTLNILKWLADLSAEAGSQATYSSYLPRADEKVIQYVSEAGDEKKVEQEGERRVFPEPGIVRIKGSTSSRYLAVNFTSEQESNYLKARTIALPSVAPRVKEMEGQQSWAPLLALLVALLLLADLLLSGFRSMRERAV